MSSCSLIPSSNISAHRRVVSVLPHSQFLAFMCKYSVLLLRQPCGLCLMILLILLSHLFSVSVEKHPSHNISSRSCMSLSTGGERCFQEAWLDHFAQLSRTCNAAWVDNWRMAKSNTVHKCQHYSTHQCHSCCKQQPQSTQSGVLAVVLVTGAQHSLSAKKLLPHAVIGFHTT